MTDTRTSGSNAINSLAYGFTGKEEAYVANRPTWNAQFARYSLEVAGCVEENGQYLTADGCIPVIASMGAGPGVDAAEFKRLGCDVRLVEPNPHFLAYSRAALSSIPGGRAEFFHAPAVDSGLPERSIDLIICAQSIHSMKHAYSSKYLSHAQQSAGIEAEEWTRKHWSKLLHGEGQQVFVWYYNPDPNSRMVVALHDILVETLPAYANSGTQFHRAEYFKPNHFQPWIAADAMTVSPRMAVDDKVLKRDMVAKWLESYSFAPPGPETTAMAKRLTDDWFDTFAMEGSITLRYVGFVASGPLRTDTFDKGLIGNPLELDDPLSPDS